MERICGPSTNLRGVQQAQENQLIFESLLQSSAGGDVEDGRWPLLGRGRRSATLLGILYECLEREGEREKERKINQCD